jgi:hypothetical protein
MIRLVLFNKHSYEIDEIMEFILAKSVCVWHIPPSLEGQVRRAAVFRG